MEQTLLPDPANDIYVRCESGDTIYYTKLNRENLHYYLPETQRLLGGRNDHDSTYDGKDCFHLSFENYKKIAYVYINEPTEKPDKFNLIKILRNLVPLMKTDLIFNELQYYNTCFIGQLIKKYPPISPTCSGDIIKDDELEQMLNQVNFPYSLCEYYKMIRLCIGDMYYNITYISSLSKLDIYPWIRKYPLPILTIYDGYYGDMNIIHAQKGTFGKVNKLYIITDVVKFEYADVVKLRDTHLKEINCRVLIIGNYITNLEFIELLNRKTGPIKCKYAIRTIKREGAEIIKNGTFLKHVDYDFVNGNIIDKSFDKIISELD